MDVEVRSVGPDELEQFVRAVAVGFFEEPDEHWLERVRRLAVPGRDLAAFDGPTIVGTAGAIPFRLTVPGGELAAAGVTAVAVHATHRRRGILRGLMRRQLDDARDRGEPLAVLWASEGGIYPNFGYGLASLNVRLAADRDWMVFRDAPQPATVRLLSHGEALELLPPLYDRVRASSPGFYTRSGDWWDAASLADDSESRRGAGPLFRAHLELEGRPAGYALYRMKHVWTHGVPEGELHVKEALALSPEAYRELWRFLFGADLVRTVMARRLPLDEPLSLLVTEPTRLGLSIGDGLYLRLVDVGAALTGRGYAADGRLVFEVLDEFCAWNAGEWELVAEEGRGALTRSKATAGLRLTAGDLASVYLGAFTFGQLVRAGRVVELEPGAVARADTIFRADRAPWCPEGF